MTTTLGQVRERLNPYVGAVLRALREETRKTREEIYAELEDPGFSMETFGRIERGTTPITTAHLEVLGERYGVEIAVIFERAVDLRAREMPGGRTRPE